MTARRRPLATHPRPLLLLLLAPVCLAYPRFTTPVAGATVPVGTVEVRWEDSDTTPLISELTSYTLKLMIGGNAEEGMLVLNTFTSDGLFQTTGNAGSGNISAGIAGPLENGFFFQIVSTTDYDKQIINYSDRFSIAGLTGTNRPIYINAVNALHGNTSGPAMQRPGGPKSSASATVRPTQTVHHTSATGPVKTSTMPRSSATSKPVVAGSGSLGLSSAETMGVGIGVGCGVGTFLLLALVIWYLRRRRRRRNLRRPRVASHNPPPDPMAKPELPADEPARSLVGSSFTQLVEADHASPLSEMDSTNTKFELEGDMPPVFEATNGRLSTSSGGFSIANSARESWRNSHETLASLRLTLHENTHDGFRSVDDKSTFP